jgi:TolB-like protein/DNA-binding winged helix-turn-helix (wHTH) protein/Tfp pilus assembly protein PilF
MSEGRQMAEAPSTPRLLRFGVFELDQQTGELRKSGLKLGLQDQPLQVLTMLLERPGELVTREELKHRLWPDNTFVDFEQGLNAAVKRLRTTLGDSADAPRFIETLPRRGYRFIAAVDGPVVGTSSRRAPWSPRQWGVVAAGAVVIAAALFWSPPEGLRLRGTASGRRIESVAVLPLENLSGDPDQEYFVDGIHEALITDLAKLSRLRRVIARSSVARYRKTEKSLAEIARELNVDAIVTGAVLQDAGRVRVTAQLIHGSSEELLWTERYEREYRDVIVLQGEIVTAIAHQIEIKLSPAEQVRLARARPVDTDAHKSYLEGRYHLNKHTHKGYAKAVESLEQAVARDPDYAPAHAALAYAYGLLGGFGDFAPRDWLPKARRSALKAVDMDDQLAEAHIALAWVSAYYDWDWQAAEREFSKAVELDPGYAEGHHLYANFLARMGRRTQARAEIERAQQLDPLSLTVSDHAAWIAYIARDYERAVELYRKTLDLDPNYILALRELSIVYVLQGRHAEAVELADKAARLSPDGPTMGRIGIVYGLAGQREQALQVLDHLMERRKRDYVPPIEIAMVHIGLGQKDQAFEWLNRAYDDRLGRMIGLKELPLFDRLRDDPRFEDLLRRMNFPP